MNEPKHPAAYQQLGIWRQHACSFLSRVPVATPDADQGALENAMQKAINGSKSTAGGNFLGQSPYAGLLDSIRLAVQGKVHVWKYSG